MKRARGTESRQARNYLFTLPCEILVLIGNSLELCDLHSYTRLLFEHYGIARFGEAFLHVPWTERQTVLLAGMEAHLHAKNILAWTGWFQGKCELMMNQLWVTKGYGKTMAEIQTAYDQTLRIAASKYYEVRKFARDDLCERCRARGSLGGKTPSLCSPCRSDMDDRIYTTQLPPDADPYSWVGRGLLRSLRSLKRNTDVDEFARQHNIRSRVDKGAKRLYLLKDVRFNPVVEANTTGRARA